jgi:ribosomal protein L23
MSAMRPRKSQKTQAQPEKKTLKKMTKLLALNPRLSEKAYAISEADNTYIFDVAAGSNKFDIANAVAAQYEVSVKRVRVAAVPGKTKRTYRQGGRKSIEGTRSAIRKAYVTLNEGDKLPIFAAVEADEAPKETK